MKRAEYERWLQAEKYQANTITAQLHRAGRVDECYGDLDEHFKVNQLADVIADLAYSADDKHHNRPNTTKIPFQGDIYNNLASYRDAVRRYRKFLVSLQDENAANSNPDSKPNIDTEPEEVAPEISAGR